MLIARIRAAKIKKQQLPKNGLAVRVGPRDLIRVFTIN